jgi:endo-1,4-beta-xylanase
MNVFNKLCGIVSLIAFVAVGEITAQNTLKDAATFPVGASLGFRDLKNNAAYKKVVNQEMSSVSVENAQKWKTIHPEEKRFDFTESDYIVDWAIKNNKRVHGHTLLWHSYNPKWLSEFDGNAAAWDSLMKTHIQTVVRHFKGRVLAWDVVNEAFTDEGELRNVESEKKESSIWREKVGPDYIEKAFRYAHEADPEALLFYNDFGQENKPKKQLAILTMVADFKRRDIPIHGLGLQFHMPLSKSVTDITQAIATTAMSGLKVHISELDILVSEWKKDSTLQYTETLQQQHADKFQQVVEIYRRYVPESQQHGITTWNVGDTDSWITKMGFTDWPLLFDENYQPKKTYEGFRKGLMSELD